MAVEGSNQVQIRTRLPRKEKTPLVAMLALSMFASIGTTGFEPATYWSQTSRATKLRYVPKSLPVLTPVPKYTTIPKTPLHRLLLDSLECLN
jgi:hypothetical protein